jgi:Csm2 Type III-A
MPDIKNAFKIAGFEAGGRQSTCKACGKPFAPRKPEHRLCSDCLNKSGRKAITTEQAQVFPAGYPDYFGEDGELKAEFLTTLAEGIAEHLGKSRMTMHQLRAFYGHVKLQQGAMKRGTPFSGIRNKILVLQPLARERFAKGKVPEIFEQFIVRNLEKVKDETTFLKGFVEHFQAVVAYCAGTIEKR